VTIHPYAKSCGELQIIGIGNDTFALDTGNGTELVACGEPSKSLVIELTEMHEILFIIPDVKVNFFFEMFFYFDAPYVFYA